MPNSGFQGQINTHFEGMSKRDILPLNPRLANQNLPNPAFWSLFVRNIPSKSTCHGSFNADSSQTIGTFSRHMQTQHIQNNPTSGHGMALSQDESYHEPEPLHQTPFPSVLRGGIIANSVAPFSTLSKPTCGYFFSRSTDQKKRRSGIPPADLVKWRYYVK